MSLLSAISASYKRTIYDRSKSRLNINQRSRDIIYRQRSFRFYMLINCKHPLYNFHKPYTIEEIALDTTTRSSIYKRSYITDAMISLANNLEKYYKF